MDAAEDAPEPIENQVSDAPAEEADGKGENGQGSAEGSLHSSTKGEPVAEENEEQEVKVEQPTSQSEDAAEQPVEEPPNEPPQETETESEPVVKTEEEEEEPDVEQTAVEVEGADSEKPAVEAEAEDVGDNVAALEEQSAVAEGVEQEEQDKLSDSDALDAGSLTGAGQGEPEDGLETKEPIESNEAEAVDEQEIKALAGEMADGIVKTVEEEENAVVEAQDVPEQENAVAPTVAEADPSPQKGDAQTIQNPAPGNSQATDKETHQQGTAKFKEQQQPHVPQAVPKHKRTYPFIARVLKESTVMAAVKKPAMKHDYFGLIFSSQSKRPPGYYHNYFLPLQKQPTAQQHLKVVGKTIPAEAVKPFLTAPLHAMPVSTIKVRWVMHRRATIYKASDLYAYLTKYGDIRFVYQLSNNSALVVFQELSGAQAAVQDPTLGYPWNSLIADWLEPRMNNKGYFRKYVEKEGSPFGDEYKNGKESWRSKLKYM